LSDPAAQKSPLSDVRDLILKPVEADMASGKRVRDALMGMGREGDFGRLGEAAEWLARWQRRFPPRIEKPTLAIFAGSHGIVDQGVSLSSNSDTRAHIDALAQGRAPLSAIATQAGATVRVFELALDRPTPSIAKEAAMTERECAATIAYGFEAVEDKPDLLAIAVSGAGVGTAAAAVACALYGGSPDYWVRPSAQKTRSLNFALSCDREPTYYCRKERERGGGGGAGICSTSLSPLSSVEAYSRADPSFLTATRTT
jgi:nicotinate-nucleotide--dimethylbenzimidazole phosphoribosyltransferase